MSAGNLTAQYVGPYKLDKTLGKGQTGMMQMQSICILTNGNLLNLYSFNF